VPLLLALACAGCLALFLNKPFHEDDPLFLWAAQQIQRNPADFYGFKVNWYTSEVPMAEVTKNPPLTSYYIALAAWVFGWSELALHLVFLLPATGVVVGTYLLAERFGSRPMLAALSALFTPAFLVSSTNVMSDTLMLCFWVWAVILWDLGLIRQRLLILCLSGVLISLSFLTKYFGLTLVPLLAVYTLTQRPRPAWWWLALLIPAATVIEYHCLTQKLYGTSLLTEAAVYARKQSGEARGVTLGSQTLVSLSFTGACVSSVLFYSLLMWSRRSLAAGCLVIGLLTWLVFATGTVGRFPLPLDKLSQYAVVHSIFPLRHQGGVYLCLDEMIWPVIVQTALFAAAGIGVLTLAVADLRANRDGRSLLLFLWVVGTWFFTGFLNWTANARSILPMVPAISILLMRRIDKQYAAVSSQADLRLWWALVPAACLALLTTAADYGRARSARWAAEFVHEHLQDTSHTLWFSGHSGFQYYMEKYGGRAVDVQNSRPEPGDVLIVPLFNGGVGIPPQLVAERPSVRSTVLPGLSTSNPLVGAGFYNSEVGPLPFVFGSTPDEIYYVLVFKSR
jgi:4-amino-4-deoxy-L-arabinose transferase-like glycosyltransferase